MSLKRKREHEPVAIKKEPEVNEEEMCNVCFEYIVDDDSLFRPFICQHGVCRDCVAGMAATGRTPCCPKCKCHRLTPPGAELLRYVASGREEDTDEGDDEEEIELPELIQAEIDSLEQIEWPSPNVPLRTWQQLRMNDDAYHRAYMILANFPQHLTITQNLGTVLSTYQRYLMLQRYFDDTRITYPPETRVGSVLHRMLPTGRNNGPLRAEDVTEAQDKWVRSYLNYLANGYRPSEYPHMRRDWRVDNNMMQHWRVCDAQIA